MTENDQNGVNEDFLIILRTIFTFLDNHNFKTTLNALNSECARLGLTNFQIDKLYPLKTVNKNAEDPRKALKNFKPLENGKECVSVTDEELIGSVQSEDLTPRPSDLLPIGNYRDIKPSRRDDEPGRKTDYEINNRENLLKETQLKKAKRPSITEDSIAAESSFEEDSLSPPDNLKDRFILLQDEHRKLMEITAKLTVAFQRNIQGQTENMNTILNNCKDIFPELFCPKSASKNKKCFALSKEQFSQYITHEIIDIGRKNSTASSNFSTDTFEENPPKPVDDLPSNFQLDFQKIKTDLRNGDTTTKLALLQALRWRITRNPSSTRNEVMATYERFDLLDIRNCSHRNGQALPKNSKLLESFYCPKKTPDILQESIARLINTFASMKLGRDYLTRQSILMNFLLSILLGTHSLKPKLDSKTRDMTIATMQKMSLRYWQRVTMINAGLCKYMVKFLSDNYKKLSSYCLEYSTALLMNLWLHVDAREKCYPLVKDIIKLLATLLDIKYENCLPYINGSFYSLLPDPVFHKIAKDVKLGQIIEYRIPSAESDMQEQLRCILKIYHDPTNWQPMCDCDLGVEIENEIDLFEPELDADDKFYTNALSGEQLLYNFRLLFPINGSQVCANNVVVRPMTPNFGKRTSFAVNSLSPYAKEENTYVVPGPTNTQYKQIKDFLIDRLSDNCIYREIDRIRNETEAKTRDFIVLESDVENNNSVNEKIEYLTKKDAKSDTKEESNVIEADENDRIRIIFKGADESTSEIDKNEKIEIQIKEIDTDQKTITDNDDENTVKLIIIHDGDKKPPAPKKKPQKSLAKTKPKPDKNNNKRKTTEKDFMADTQKYHNKSANVTKSSADFHRPSSKKEKHKSLPSTPFYREPFVYACASTSTDAFLNGGYWEGDPVCFCSPQPTATDGKNKKSKYSCQCYEKMKNSFDRDSVENAARDSPDRILRSEYVFSSHHCKYAGLCNNLNCPHRSETDSGFGSRPLDETDYDAVFESRPKILRTP